MIHLYKQCRGRTITLRRVLTVLLTAQRKDEGAVVEHPLFRIRTRHEHVLHQENARLDCSRGAGGPEGRAVDVVFRYFKPLHFRRIAFLLQFARQTRRARVRVLAQHAVISGASAVPTRTVFYLRRCRQRHGHSPRALL